MENDKGGWVECQMYVWRAPTCYKSERGYSKHGAGEWSICSCCGTHLNTFFLLAFGGFWIFWSWPHVKIVIYQQSPLFLLWCPYGTSYLLPKHPTHTLQNPTPLFNILPPPNTTSLSLSMTLRLRLRCCYNSYKWRTRVQISATSFQIKGLMKEKGLTWKDIPNCSLKQPPKRTSPSFYSSSWVGMTFGSLLIVWFCLIFSFMGDGSKKLKQSELYRLMGRWVINVKAWIRYPYFIMPNQFIP